MTSDSARFVAEGLPAAGQDDAVLPFAVEALDLRGRLARLGPALDAILTRHAYPEPVARLLGEAAALTVLLGTALKSGGRFQLADPHRRRGRHARGRFRRPRPSARFRAF